MSSVPDPRRRLALGAALASILLAVLLPWLERLRPPPPEARGGRVSEVIQGGDGGPGSLREAILAADRAPWRARIVLAVRRVRPLSPLPPLLNPKGVIIDGGPFGAAIEGDGMDSKLPLLDIAAPHTLLRNIAVRNSAGTALRIRAPGIRLDNVTLEANATGVKAEKEAGALVVRGCHFTGNGIGLDLPPGAATSIVANAFRDHREAAIWAVSAPSREPPSRRVEVAGNRFRGDRVGVVLANVPARVEKNTFLAERTAALVLEGVSGLIRANRIRGAGRFGIAARATLSTVIEGNEIDHNPGVGILLRDGVGTIVRDNRVYANGYGIAVVFGSRANPNLIGANLVADQHFDGLYVVGGTPVLRRNVVLRNRGAALRLLDYLPRRGAPRRAAPLLDHNRIEDNHPDSPRREIYREPEP